MGVVISVAARLACHWVAEHPLPFASWEDPLDNRIYVSSCSISECHSAKEHTYLMAMPAC